MKTITTIILVVTMISSSFSQEIDTLRIKLDSIVTEANRLYSYEKTVWESTDMLLRDRKLKRDYGTYVMYHQKDTLVVAYINKELNTRIAKYVFLESNLKEPIEVDKNTAKLAPIEEELLTIKLKLSDQLSSRKCEFNVPSGYNPNLVLIKGDEEYKLYVIMGTTKSGSIPFGNDYLFIANSAGDITYCKKFHSRILPAPFKGQSGGKVVSAFHSHLKTTPYITATDICTFRLYYELSHMEEFSVYCTATDKVYKYSIATNRVEVTDL